MQQLDTLDQPNGAFYIYRLQMAFDAIVGGDRSRSAARDADLAPQATIMVAISPTVDIAAPDMLAQLPAFTSKASMSRNVVSAVVR